jgi:hypothetical protein
MDVISNMSNLHCCYFKMGFNILLILGYIAVIKIFFGVTNTYSCALRANNIGLVQTGGYHIPVHIYCVFSPIGNDQFNPLVCSC